MALGDNGIKYGFVVGLGVFMAVCCVCILVQDVIDIASSFGIEVVV